MNTFDPEDYIKSRCMDQSSCCRIFDKETGKQLRLNSGKCVWQTIGHAKSAMTLDLEKVLGSERGSNEEYYEWEARKKAIIKHVQSLVEFKLGAD